MFTDATGARRESPNPRPSAAHRPLTPALKRRNDAILSVARNLGARPWELARLFGLAVETIRGALREARDRQEARGGADPAPGLDGPRLTSADLLDTPLTDDPRGPRYSDDPEAAAWIREHADEINFGDLP
jgi:hypothetical protein